MGGASPYFAEVVSLGEERRAYDTRLLRSKLQNTYTLDDKDLIARLLRCATARAEMSSHLRAWFCFALLFLAFSTRVLAEFEYERLSRFEPLAHQADEFTLGADGYAYTVASGTSQSSGQRILRADAQGRISTVVVFARDTDLRGARRWLVKGPDGLLYGSATNTVSDSVIYRLTPSGQVEVLGAGGFTIAPVFGGDGALYGCSELPGISRFRLTGEFESVPGTESTRSANGPLYQLVERNGEIFFAAGNALWKIDASGLATQHLSLDAASPFAATIGTNLHGSLVKGKSGILYGMTTAGGPESRGSILKVSLTGTVELLVPFGTQSGRLDGSSIPFNMVEGSGGNLFHVSTRRAEGRDVFAIRPGGTAEKIGVLPVRGVEIHSLVTGNDNEAYGVYVVGDTLSRRTIFKFSLEAGVTVVGESPAARDLDGEYIKRLPIIGPDGGIWAIGSASASGTHIPHMVRLHPDQTFEETPLIAGDGLLGQNPADLNVLPDGSIVGIAESANRDSDNSTVFQIHADGSVRFLDQVGKAQFAPVQFGDGSLVGFSVKDGNSLVYRIEPDGTRSDVKLVTSGSGFPANSQPQGKLVRGSNGAWYGLTRSGGTFGSGTIVRVTEPFSVSSIYHFANLSGDSRPKIPVGSFVPGDDGSLYAIAAAGGQHGVGGLIRYTPGGAVSLVASFTEPIVSILEVPSYPVPQLVRGENGWFYGVTSYSGNPGTQPGSVFGVSTAGEFRVLGRFTGNGGALPGSYPRPYLTPGKDGEFYGVTTRGGANDHGTIFRVTPNGEVRKFVSFSGVSGIYPGASPLGPLVQRGHVLYGTCAKGGRFDSGTIFRIDQNRHLAVALELTGTDGLSPGYAPGGLALGQDGHLYGAGGSNTFTGAPVSKTAIFGTLFRLQIGDAAGVADDTFELPATRINVLANDGFDLAAQASKIASLTQPAHGRVTLNNDGTVSYKPDVTFKGTDSFTYTAKQGTKMLGTATVTLVDTTLPKLVKIVPPTTLAVDDAGKVVLPDYAGTSVVEDAGGPVAAEQTPAAGTLLEVGPHAVTLKFTDVAGHSLTKVLEIVAIDATPPVMATKPADRTFTRTPGEFSPVCPNLTAEVSATDNVQVLKITQTPLAGTVLPDGYTRFVVSVSDGRSEVSHVGWIRVIPAPNALGTTGDIAPGFEEEHRYHSFGLPAIAANGMLAFKAVIKATSGGAKTAIFSGKAGVLPAVVAFTGGAEGLTEIGEPLVNSVGAVAFKAKSKSSNGKPVSGIWVSANGQPIEPLVQSGTPLPATNNDEVFRDFIDVSLLESGAVLVHATVGKVSGSSRERTLWLVENGTWHLLLRAGDPLTLDGKASRIREFTFGNVLPRVGAQTRSFNAAGQVVSRVTLADKRSAIVRVSVSGTDVLVEPLLTAGTPESPWATFGIPAMNDAGDIAFRGRYKVERGRDPVLGHIAAGETTPSIVSSPSIQKLGDPIVMPSGNVAIPAWISGWSMSLYTWNKSSGHGFNLRRVDDALTDKTDNKFVTHFDSIAATNSGLVSIARYRRLPRGAFTRGIIRMDYTSAILQGEGDAPPVSDNTSETIRRIDCLTPVLGAGGQTRSVNFAGQIAFRAKLSSGKTAIYVIAL